MAIESTITIWVSLLGQKRILSEANYFFVILYWYTSNLYIIVRITCKLYDKKHLITNFPATLVNIFLHKLHFQFECIREKYVIFFLYINHQPIGPWRRMHTFLKKFKHVYNSRVTVSWTVLLILLITHHRWRTRNGLRFPYGFFERRILREKQSIDTHEEKCPESWNCITNFLPYLFILLNATNSNVQDGWSHLIHQFDR